MLQVISGKFFTTDDLYVTRHHGVLYTNFRVLKSIETEVGTLHPGTVHGGVFGAVYEVYEKLEKDGSGLVSVGASHLVDDFAAVVSFALNATFTPDLDTARRLFSKAPALGTYRPPSRLIRRVFDVEIGDNLGDILRLPEYVRTLIGLPRRHYEAVMRAIRRYITGLHRVVDDFDLAYALLVASIESLAQSFDDFVPIWADYDDRKRGQIDKALQTAPSEVAAQVREAILKNEHVALSRRFREFCLAHIGPTLFRSEAQASDRPIQRRELDIALKKAYEFRSSYVHELRPLPRVLSAGWWTGDVASDIADNNKPMLTVQGLATVARHVIEEFILRCPQVEREEYDYRRHLPNTVVAEFAPQYWVHQAEGFDSKSATRYLGGFLTQLVGALRREPDAALTDMERVFDKIESMAKGLGVKNRRPMVAMYWLWNVHINPEHQRTGWMEFAEQFLSDFDEPSIESLLMHILTDQDPGWTFEQYETLRDGYFETRYHKGALKLPDLLEAALTLHLAEVYRQKDIVNRAQDLIAEAVELLPKHEGLAHLEAATMEGLDVPVDWRSTLLSTPSAAEVVM
jgi:hypothetical protein